MQRFNVMVPARDGVRLATDIYVADASRPVPALVLRTPYNKNQAILRELASKYNARGYAVVVQDCRGRGDSDGSFVPYFNEGRDGYDLIEWISNQEWCDGDVALRGASYAGRSCWLTALEKPPHLRGMVVLVAPSDPFVESPTSSTSGMGIHWHRLVDGRMVQETEGIDWMDVYAHLPRITMDERAGFFSQIWKDTILHETLDEFWEQIRYQHRMNELDVPVLHISGWYDDEQIGTPLNFSLMTRDCQSERSRAQQAILMGPWGHAVNAGRKLGEVDFGPDAVIDLDGYIVDWLDEVLGRGPRRIPRVCIFVMGVNEWRDEEEWPLQRAQLRTHYLRSDGNANSRFGTGRLSTEPPPDGEQPDRFLYHPSRPVPFITDASSVQIGGPDDYSAIEQRGDILCYSTDPFESDFEVTGPIKVTLFASSSAVDTDFAAKLVDVHPSGFCQRLCDGIVRARYRNGHQRAEFMEPGIVYPFEIDLWNTAQVFKAGHSIRLEVTSSAFPKYDRNLNTGQSLATGTDMVTAENTIWHDAARASCIVLPIVPAK